MTFFVSRKIFREVSGDACENTVDRITEAATPRPPLLSPPPSSTRLSDLKLRMSLRRRGAALSVPCDFWRPLAIVAVL